MPLTRWTLLSLLAIALPAAAQTPPPTDAGPFGHQVMSASSPDGLTWTFDGQVLLEHASVPAAIVTPEGWIRVYYVDASNVPETTNCAESRDGGHSFTVLGCAIAGRGGIKALDPSIVLLPDRRYRLYYYASATTDPGAPGQHSIHSAISTDGVRFTDEGAAFSYPGLVDPDVYWTGREWVMAVFSGDMPGTVLATSADGLRFTYAGPHPLQGWGTTAPVRLSDSRFRLYAFSQHGQQVIGSFLSDDGLSWTQEPGERLHAAAGEEITDPFVVQLRDGTWKMLYKRSRGR